MKRIPFVNYVKVVLLFITSFIICVVIFNNYKSKKEYENSILNYFDQTIKIKELENFLKDNHDGYIYMVSSNILDKSFINEINEIIKANDLEHSFTYLDNSVFNNKDYEVIINNLTKKNVDINKTSNIFYFSDGKIVDALLKNNENINIDNVRKFIIDHQGLYD